MKILSEVLEFVRRGGETGMVKAVSVIFHICDCVKNVHTLSETSAVFPLLIIKFGVNL
jgi:hypothetical protein